MINLIKKRFDPNNLEVIYKADFSEAGLKKDFDIKSGEWRVEDGWLIGKNPNNSPGMIISKQDFFGNVMLEFDAQTILPSTHDINVMWHGSWNEVTDERDTAYVVGIQGWWDGKVGFEKSPDYVLHVATQIFDFKPGQLYHVQVGSIDGHIFIIIDGKLILEIMDPSPVDHNKYGKVGFEAYSSHIKIKNFVIKKIEFEEDEKEYTKEF